MQEERFKIIYLELTNACNFTCDYCPIDQQTRKKTIMSSEFARDVINQIATNNLTKFLTFHLMGEPFLHKDLCTLTGYAEERGLRVRLLTNGSLLERSRNEGLFKNHLSRLEVGFRTPNDSSFNMRLRGGRLSLDQYIQRVKDLIEDKIRMGAKTELCIKFFLRSHVAAMKLSDPYEHLTSGEDNLRIAKLFKAHTLSTARKYNVPTKGWDDLPVRLIDADYSIFPGINIGFSRIQDFWVREQRGEHGSQGYRAFIGGCSAGFRDDFGILASGEVTTCCVDYDGRNVIGNLHEQSLMEILESAEANRILRSFKWFVPPTQFCRECRGGPTLLSSIAKQAATVAIDIKERVAPRKQYQALRDRLETNQ
jgi:MoaA/NifB/PqqE/SkfB family radical SAM enzyme